MAPPDDGCLILWLMMVKGIDRLSH